MNLHIGIFSKNHTILLTFQVLRKVPLMKLLYRVLEFIFFLFFGGFTYYFLELFFRGFSHYSMVLCGGLAFYAVSLFNRYFEYSLHIITRLICSALIITAMELIFGIIFNLYLGKNIWNYSEHAIHYKGQICLTFSILWFFLSYPVLYIEKWIRMHLFSTNPCK